MAVYDPSHLSHFVKSQPVNPPDEIGQPKVPTKSFASELEHILNEDPSPIQTIFDDLSLSKLAQKQQKSISQNLEPQLQPKLHEDQFSRRFVTL